jgi:hypothetical protein
MKTSRLQDIHVLFINFDRDKPKATEFKKGNIKNTNLLSNKVERFELLADYFRDSLEQKSLF